MTASLEPQAAAELPAGASAHATPAAHVLASDMAAAHAMAVGRRAAATRDNARKVVATFNRWAEHNGEPPVPTTEQAVLRWLHCHYDDWGHGTMSAYVDGLRLAHRDADACDPTCGSVREYLSAVARTKGRRTLPRVAALDLAEVARAAGEQLQSQFPGGRVLELRATVAVLLARSLHVALIRLVEIRADAVVLTPAGLHLTVPGGVAPGALATSAQTFLLARTAAALDPVAAVEELLALLPAGTTRLLGFAARLPGPGERPVPAAANDLRTGAVAAKIRAQVRGAAGRANLDPARLAGDGLAPALDDSELGWLLAHLNPSFVRQLRDLTYALLGVATASRHDDLTRLRTSDVEPSPQGWQVSFRSAKNNAEGRDEHTRVRPVEHETDDDEPCPPWCPACALDRWLTVTRRCWPAGDGLLLPAMKAMTGPTGRLDVWYGTLILRRLLGRDDVSTRGMRAGGITALRAEGAALNDIAEVSGHRSMTNLTRYLRLLDPHTDQYHLPL